MKIGVDASRANLAQRTGTEQYAYHLIQEWKKLTDPSDQFILYSKSPLTNGLETHWPAHFQSRVLQWAPQFLWTQFRLSLEMLRSRPEVLFVPAHTLPLFLPRKSVVTLHDVGFERFDRLYMREHIGTSGPVKKLLNAGARLVTLGKYGASELDYHRWSTNFTIKHATKIITVSEFSKREIVACYPNIDPNRISVIYHGVDHARFQPMPDGDERRQRLNRYGIHRPFLLFIGRLEEKKNISGLISIFGELKKAYHEPLDLVLVGKPGFRHEQMLKRIKELQLTDSVIQTGYVAEEDLVALRSAASAFVFPSYYEGFGMPILESMSCGTPVVSSNRASLPEVVGSAGLMADPDDHREFASQIHRLLTQPALRQDYVDKGLIWARRFSWSDAAARTLDVIRQCAKK